MAGACTGQPSPRAASITVARFRGPRLQPASNSSANDHFTREIEQERGIRRAKRANPERRKKPSQELEIANHKFGSFSAPQDSTGSQTPRHRPAYASKGPQRSAATTTTNSWLFATNASASSSADNRGPKA